MTIPQYNVWRFVSGDLRLAHDDGRRIVAGKTLRVDGPAVLCGRGFHGSLTLRDALDTGAKYTSNPLLTSSRISGNVNVGIKKLCGTILHTDWIATREETDRFLRLWAVWCARSVLHLAFKTDHKVLENTINVAEQYAWRRATDKKLNAAWSAARRVSVTSTMPVAAEAAVLAAAAAAADPTWHAAPTAATAATTAYAATNSAWSVAWNAAQDAQEVEANRLFVELFGGENG